MEERPARAVLRGASSERTGWIAVGAAAALVLVILLWVCIAVIPQRLYPALTDAQLPRVSDQVTEANRVELREARLKLQNDARTTLLQALAALLVLVGAGIGALVTLRQVRISRDQLVANERQARAQLDVAREQVRLTERQAREQLDVTRQQAQAAERQAREQLEATERQAREQLNEARQQAQAAEERAREELAIAREGQITDRFTKAVEQLGNRDSLDVRLGGIYALARIAHDSDTHRLAIFDILLAYIRGHAPWPPPPGPDGVPPLFPADIPLEELPFLQVRLPDVQAALTVLGERPIRDNDPSLDLRNTDLRGADLIRAKFRRANFEGAHLERARLMYADLTGAYFMDATLKWIEAPFSEARKARFDRADMERAWIGQSHFEGAKFFEADLTLATLNLTHLEEAVLEGATLEGAFFEGTFADSNTIWPDGYDQESLKAKGLRFVPGRDIPKNEQLYRRSRIVPGGLM